ncbi:uncharacterized protein RJT20DRAFT_32073 [Scheffersomyces xylosifermentans]|uniref:uncharacterized protein n=1 Tax=Scheffersomyces xylosifermentans TaxID=1304137 RepID=UPI00315D321B
MPVSLLDLPKAVRKNIILFLPQQELINLATTNYELYEPCMQQLYKRIVVQADPVLTNDPKGRNNDFLDGNLTVIYGFRHNSKSGKVYTLETQLKLVNARLAVLNQSVSINPALLEYIQEISIISENGQFNAHDDIKKNIQALANHLDGHSINKFFIGDAQLRAQIDLSKLSLRSVVIDSASQFEAANLHSCVELLVALDTTKDFNVQKFKSLELESLILPDDEIKYWEFVDNILFANDIQLKVSTFKLLFSKDLSKNTKLSKCIYWPHIHNLEILLGHENEDQDFVIDLLNLIPLEHCIHLQKLSIVQLGIYTTHKSNEAFDINVFTFIDNLVQIQSQSLTKSRLNYISIKHNLPATANFPDGFEGNYLRRYKSFGDLLPKLLVSKTDEEQPKINLFLPNVFQTLACYDQPMNTMLWNGCKCPHCEDYLGKLDDFLMYHKYYNSELKSYKDLNSSLIMFTIGEFLNSRFNNHDLLTGLSYLHYPLSNRLWNFHDSALSIPFRCYDVQIIDQGEFDEEVEEEAALNISETLAHCKYNAAVYNRNIPLSISHYLDDLVLKLINLNRGDAEAFELGTDFRDGGDSEDLKLNINKLVLNGISYNLDRELNGTHFFEDVLDY